MAREHLALGLTILMVVAPLYGDPQNPASPPAAQSPAPAGAPTQPMAPLPLVQGLKLLPLAGKDGMNDLERRIMSPLVVQVTDQNAQPVEGADVVFRFPLSGPGATFNGGKPSQVFRTNGQGQAAAMNWMANDKVGTFTVHVTATYGNQTGETTFSMSNVTRIVEEGATAKKKKGSWWSPTWVKVAVIGGAAAAIGLGVYLGTRGGGGSSTSTVTITPGTPSVGGPR